MGYVILVITQTIVLPIVFGSIAVATSDGDPIVLFGGWWIFWGVGTRLLLAGIAQASGRGPTAQILGSDAVSTTQQQVTRELGVANIGMGLAGLLALVPGWAAPAGLAGGVFLLVAGLLHIPKRNKNLKETVATWTDLVVGVVAVGLAVYVGVQALTA